MQTLKDLFRPNHTHLKTSDRTSGPVDSYKMSSRLFWD